MPNASTLEITWTIAFALALIFSSLYMVRVGRRGVRMIRNKENGALRTFLRWQVVLTLFFMLSEARFVLLGWLAMNAPAPIRSENAQAAETSGRIFLEWAVEFVLVQWFVWYSDGRLEREVGKATAAEQALIEAAAQTIAIVEANTEAVQENTAAVEANTEVKSGD